jgi:hypothetical protein
MNGGVSATVFQISFLTQYLIGFFPIRRVSVMPSATAALACLLFDPPPTLPG